MNISQLKLWIIEIRRWLAEGILVIMCFLVIVAAISLGFFTWRSESSIRLAGYILQLIGMIFAIRGLLGIREHFGQPLFRELLFDWFKRFPKWKRNLVVCSSSVQLESTSMKARVEVWSPDDPNLPMEQRIISIIGNIDRIRYDQNQHFKIIDELKNSHEEHKKILTNETKKIENNVFLELESLHTSDLLTSLVGLTWLIVGITMSTMSKELYIWLY